MADQVDLLQYALVLTQFWREWREGGCSSRQSQYASVPRYFVNTSVYRD
jgi:hypothetical protein